MYYDILYTFFTDLKMSGGGPPPYGSGHAAIHSEWDISCKVWIGGLEDEGTRLEIEEAFGEIGPVKNIWLAKNPPGFAFVEMEVLDF